MNEQKPKIEESDEDEAPVFWTWPKIYFWLLLLNVLFAVLFYLFMRIYTI